MTDLAAIEDRLAIRLPPTYVEAVEDFELSDTEKYRIYPPDELVWFREHDRSDLAEVDHEALVIGEAKDGSELLVLLGFEVAGIPTLSDEVYRLDADGVDADAVALDLLHLLEDAGSLAMGKKETLFETAFELRSTRPRVLAALNEALEARGFGAPPDEFDHDGEYLDVYLFGRGPILLWIRGGDILWLGRRLALLLERSVGAHTVVLEDEMVETHNGEWEFPVRTRSLDITKSGEMVDRNPKFTGETANYGDPYETASAVLWKLVDRPTGEGAALEFYRPAPPKDLSSRLVNLLGMIAEAVAVDLTEIAGQQAVRIELADGSRQMSVVDDEELDALREHGNIDI